MRAVNPGVEVAGPVLERHRGRALHRRRDRPRLGDRRRVRDRHPPREEGRARVDQGRRVQGQGLPGQGRLDRSTSRPGDAHGQGPLQLRQPGQRAAARRCTPRSTSRSTRTRRSRIPRSAILRLGDTRSSSSRPGDGPATAASSSSGVPVDVDEAPRTTGSRSATASRRGSGSSPGRHPPLGDVSGVMISETVGSALRMPAVVLAAGGGARHRAGSAPTTSLDIEAYPNPVPPLVEVITQPDGWSAEEVERYVTVPLEIGLVGHAGARAHRARSRSSA